MSVRFGAVTYERTMQLCTLCCRLLLMVLRCPRGCTGYVGAICRDCAPTYPRLARCALRAVTTVLDIWICVHRFSCCLADHVTNPKISSHIPPNLRNLSRHESIKDFHLPLFITNYVSGMNALAIARSTSRLHVRRAVPVTRALNGLARPAAGVQAEGGPARPGEGPEWNNGLVMTLGAAAAAAAVVVVSTGQNEKHGTLAAGAYSLPIGETFPSTVGVPLRTT